MPTQAKPDQDAAAAASTSSPKKASKAQQQNTNNKSTDKTLTVTADSKLDQLLIPLDNVDIVPSLTATNHQGNDDDDGDDDSPRNTPRQQTSFHFARTKQELDSLSEILLGGLTLLRNIRFDIVNKYIHVVMKPTEFTAENIPKIFSGNKEEFCVCPMYAPQFVDAAVKLGLLPMTIPFGKNVPEFLAPKLHKQRCIVRLPRCVENSTNPNFKSTLKLPEGTRKRAKKYAIIVDAGFWDLCCAELVAQHERDHGHSWLNEMLQKTYQAMNIEPTKYETNLHCFSVVFASHVPALAAARQNMKDAKNPKEKEEAKKNFDEIAKEGFCAGEIGCSVGTIYTSLTGAYLVSGSGSVQLAATAALLCRLGMEVWDLGMAMKYKTEQLGGIEVSRKKWLETAAEHSKHQPYRKLGSLDGYCVRCDAIVNSVEYFNNNNNSSNSNTASQQPKAVAKDAAS